MLLTRYITCIIITQWYYGTFRGDFSIFKTLILTNDLVSLFFRHDTAGARRTPDGASVAARARGASDAGSVAAEVGRDEGQGRITARVSDAETSRRRETR